MTGPGTLVAAEQMAWFRADETVIVRPVLLPRGGVLARIVHALVRVLLRLGVFHFFLAREHLQDGGSTTASSTTSPTRLGSDG